ncbi:MAG: VOC family protein [Pseudonocardiales bacterium]|nr:VOC family protein [Pseudonocardiales bacterium]
MPVRTTPWPAGTPCWADAAVPDVPAAVAFYRALFGWDFVDLGPEFGHYGIARVDGRDAAAVGPTADPAQPAAWTVYLATDDADATVAAVRGHGGSVLVEPMEIPGRGRMAVVTDVTGAVVGLWEAGGMRGAEVVDAPGGLIWEDARLTDPLAGQQFFAAVFGYTFDAVPGAPDGYATFRVDGTVAGGIGGMDGAPEGTPGHWLPYFMVADVDAALAAAQRGGGTVLMAATDTGFGRMGIVTDPFGATLALHGGLPAS